MMYYAGLLGRRFELFCLLAVRPRDLRWFKRCGLLLRGGEIERSV